jgi:hypothetical protein
LESSDLYNVLPLAIVTVVNLWAVSEVFDMGINKLAVYLLTIILLQSTAIKKYAFLFNPQRKGWDLFSIFTLINILFIPHVNIESAVLEDILKPILTSAWFLLQTTRVENQRHQMHIKALFTLSLLWPYYALLSNIRIPNIINPEITIIPLIIATYIITRIIYKLEDKYEILEYAILIISYLYLLGNSWNSLEKGMIDGVILIVSILIGSGSRWKSLFIVGNTALLINIFVQSREFWASIPWWAYLLFAGMVLIITASVNEVRKSHQNDSIFTEGLEKLRDKFESWK